MQAAIRVGEYEAPAEAPSMSSHGRRKTNADAIARETCDVASKDESENAYQKPYFACPWQRASDLSTVSALSYSNAGTTTGEGCVDELAGVIIDTVASSRRGKCA